MASTDPERHRRAAEDLAQAVAALDVDFLARMTSHQRSRQFIVRDELAGYFDLLAKDLQLRGADTDGTVPADHLAALEALRTLAWYLHASVDQAITDADDFDDPIEWPFDPFIADAEAAEQARLEEWIATATLAEIEAARATCNPTAIFTIDQAIERRRTAAPQEPAK